ncbi:MAG TPA: gamma-glutamyltransferase [Actinophytocola sp.]|jgi:gamma-glutamyltranspeptidase/glutathione hydrolase|nr:gamma-glutamyltransferase [Actinophytocola sp.]
MAILERGGNAFDAAVAAGFVLQVVEPHYNGPGGEVSILVRPAGSDEVHTICGQGPTPQRATIDHFNELGLTQIPGSGLLGACVPGAFGAWVRLLAEFGTMRLRDVLDDAIGYADGGFAMLPEMASIVASLGEFFTHEWPESALLYVDTGNTAAPGVRFRNRTLANTFRRIVDEAEAASPDRDAQLDAAHRIFYQGFVAEAVDSFTASAEVLDATGRRNRALLTGADLAAWTPGIEPALHLPYRGRYGVHKPGPWTQGPVFLQQLALLDGFDLGGMGLDSADYVHTVVECAKLAFADREAWYGDPDQSEVPVGELLDPSYTELRRRLVGSSAAGEPRPGSPGGRKPWLPDLGKPVQYTSVEQPDWARQLLNGLPSVVQLTEARGDTCFVGVTDRFGNTVAATPSGGWLKCSPAVPGLGFALGTRAQVMSLDAGHPNALAPGKRPRTTLSPTLVERDGEPYLAFGTPGGDRQDQWTLEFFLAVADAGLDTQAGTESVAFHTDQVPSSFVPHESRPHTMVVEQTIGDQVIAELRQRGHEVEVVSPLSLGKVCAVGRSGTDGTVFAAASPRGPQPYAVCR